jgi:hypothetical protein
MTESVFKDCAKAYVRSNGGFYCFKPRQYDQLLEAWRGGKTFFTGESLEGEEQTVKLGEVEAVMLCTPASQEAANERSRAETKAAEREGFE